MSDEAPNGLAMAQFLQQHPKVAYGLLRPAHQPLPCPGAEISAQRFVVWCPLVRRPGGCQHLYRELKLAAIETHVAVARGLPLTSLHQPTPGQMNDDRPGVPPELVRVSTACSADLIADVAQARFLNGFAAQYHGRNMKTVMPIIPKTFATMPCTRRISL